VPEIRLARITSLAARIAEIAFGHDPKYPDGRKRAALVAVELVPVIAVHDDLPFESAWKFEAFEEDISRIALLFAWIARPVTNIIEVATIVLAAVQSRPMPQFNPGHLDVTNVFVTIAWVEVGHGSSHLWAHKDAFVEAFE